MREIKKVWVYLRCSGKQQDTSIALQRGTLFPIIEKNDWEVLGTFSDEGKSGSINPHKRKEFHKLMAAVAAGGGDAVVVWDSSRFARLDMNEAAPFKQILRKANVLLWTVQKPFDFNDSMDRLLSGINSETDNAYAQKISEKSVPGKVEKIRQGIWCTGGGVPFGLVRIATDPNGNQWEYNRLQKFRIVRGWKQELRKGEPKEVAIVRSLGEQVLKEGENFSANNAARQLNEKKIPSPNGGMWRNETVRRMLRNPHYAGAYFIGQLVNGSFWRTGKQVSQPSYDESASHRTIDEMAITWNCFDGIFSKDEFLKIQKILETKIWTGNRAKGTGRQYPLKGILVCGHCGMNRVGHTNTHRNNQITYRCSCRPATNPECYGQCRQDIILPLVLEVVGAKLGSILDMEAKPKAKKDNSQDEVAKLDKLIDRTKNRIKLATDDELFLELQDEFKSLKEQRKKLVETQSPAVHQSKAREWRLWLDEMKEKVMWLVNPDYIPVAGGKFGSGNNPATVPVEIGELNGKLLQLGLKVKVFFKDSQTNPRNRWELDRGKISFCVPDVRTQSGPH